MEALTKNLNDNFNFFVEEDLHEFSGKWIAIVNKKIVGSGENLKELMQEVKKRYPKEEPFVTRAPLDKPLIL